MWVVLLQKLRLCELVLEAMVSTMNIRGVVSSSLSLLELFGLVRWFWRGLQPRMFYLFN